MPVSDCSNKGALLAKGVLAAGESDMMMYLNLSRSGEEKVVGSGRLRVTSSITYDVMVGCKFVELKNVREK